MKMQLNPDVKYIWILSYIIRFFFFSLFLFFVDMWLSETEKWFFPFGLLNLLLFIFAIIFISIFPYFKYKYWFFELREEELYLERGVFTKVKTTAPYCRIQHIDISQSISERFLNLSKLVVYTAGTRGADLVIPGLPLYYAEEIKEQLKEYTIEDAV